MRIGTVIYVIPFFFVFNPALLLQRAPGETVVVLITAICGILLVSAGPVASTRCFVTRVDEKRTGKPRGA